MKTLSGLIVLVATAAPLAVAEPQADRVLTQEEQRALTPDQALQRLTEGNRRFTQGTLTKRDHSARIRQAASGQFPKAMVLSCIDSRIPVEDVFDQGIGDIFVARVSGNFVDTDTLGGMEFATKVSGAKLILVLGHEGCGAIKAAIDGTEMGNIPAMLGHIKPAIAALSGYEGDKSSANAEFVHLVAEKNVQLAMENIRKRSAILAELEAQGQLAVAGGLYDMKTGSIELVPALGDR
jgi:carbonic anhydrase